VLRTRCQCRDRRRGYRSQFEEINDPTTLTTIDYTFDAAGQMSFVDHDANKDASLEYDGRGFLSGVAIANIPMLESTYSSEGVLHSLLRTPSVFLPSERIHVLYFAGRPIGIWKKVGTGTATLTRIVTDHLGTPAASILEAGTAVDWYGGFAPFGEDWQAGTGQDSLAKGIFLRMPGQWKDPLWSDATYPMELFYNVHRWYESGTGRYTRPDPLGRRGDLHPYAYVRSNPLTGKVPFGLFRIKGPAPGCAIEYIQNQIPKLVDHPTIPANLATASGCSLAEVQEGLRWGSGPEVEFDDLAPGDAGEFDPNIPDRFRIDRPAAEGVCGSCACPDALLGLGISILHEYAHQLHQKCRGLETGPDIGDRFENVSYGPGGSLGPSQAFLYGCP
jgi:RHS repeat-associated protein